MTGPWQHARVNWNEKTPPSLLDFRIREKNAINSFPRWNCGIDGHLDTEGNAIWPNKLKKEAQTKGQFKFPVVQESHLDSNWL